VNAITFVIAEKHSPDGRYPFLVMRISGDRQDVVSYHATMEDAETKAQYYAVQARRSRLDARVFHRDWLLSGAGLPG
jgi:hypothetical protein